MKKSMALLIIALLAQAGAVTSWAAGLVKENEGLLKQYDSQLEKYEKAILIDQLRQLGAAYEEGEKLFEFPVITGDDETPTDPGVYVIKVKDENYYSKKYQTPMPYSMFFDYVGRRAIHEGDVPPPADRKELATHGCINVEQPYMIWLYDWADQGKTVVVIRGGRTAD